MDHVAEVINKTFSTYFRIVLFISTIILSTFTAFYLLISLFIEVNKNSAITLTIIFFFEYYPINSYLFF